MKTRLRCPRAHWLEQRQRARKRPRSPQQLTNRASAQAYARQYARRAAGGGPSCLASEKVVTDKTQIHTTRSNIQRRHMLPHSCSFGPLVQGHTVRSSTGRNLE